jgi:UDP-glucose 4-epimerase
MKILVTGGAGFIGSHIAEKYIAAGHQVEIVDDLSMGSMDNVPTGATFHNIDIRSDAFTDLIRQGAFDAINHHAAHMELRVSVDKPMHDADINVLGSVRMFEAARRAGVGHIIVASTVAVLGEFRQIPAGEDHPTRPIAPYGVSKRAMELYADYYRITHGMSISTLRYTNVYGPRQNPNGESGVIAIFLERFLDGRVPVVHGDGGQERDYVHVHDVAQANLLALERRLNDTYHVCSNTAASVNDVVRHLRHALGTDAPVEHGPPKAGDPPRTRGSHDAFSRATGWRPLVPLADGIRDTAAWFRDRH